MSKKPVCVVVGASSKWQKEGFLAVKNNDGNNLGDDYIAQFDDNLKWGVGGAICLRFAREGYAIAMLGRNVDNLVELGEAVEKAGGEALAVACDLMEEGLIEQAFAEVVEKLGPVDVLVYNAGYSSGGASEVLVEDLPTDVFDTAMSVQARGAFLACKQVLPHMTSMKGGSKGLTSSTSKAAMRGLSQSLNAEYHPHGVHVAHVVLNGFIDSPGSRALMKGNNETMLQPAALAETYWQLHVQHRLVLFLSEFFRLEGDGVLAVGDELGENASGKLVGGGIFHGVGSTGVQAVSGEFGASFENVLQRKGSPGRSGDILKKTRNSFKHNTGDHIIERVKRANNKTIDEATQMRVRIRKGKQGKYALTHINYDISARPAVDASCADKATDCASKIQNGTHCAGAFAAQCRKSCRLCWTAGSAKLAFAHTPGGKSPFLGGARKLANGNYLGNFGALTQPVCDSPCQRDFTATCLHARTCEVLPNGTEVWYARIGGKIGAGECHGWNAYRSERLTRVNETSFGRAMAAF
eukprot:g239.t1